MRKKALFIGLALSLILTTVMSTPVLAKSPCQPPKPAPPVSGSFEGTGYVNPYGITVASVSSQRFFGWYILRYRGEEVPGYLASCVGWDDLQGAVLSSTHDSIVLVDRFGNVIWGYMEGRFELATAQGTLEGSFSAQIVSGLLDPVLGSIYAIKDQGQWTSSGGTGVFDNVRASGTWGLDLAYPYQPGNGNTLLWDGQYRQGGSWGR
jgi:hypothetical protein